MSEVDNKVKKIVADQLELMNLKQQMNQVLLMIWGR